MIDIKLILISIFLIELTSIFGRFLLKVSSKEIMIKLMRYFNFKKIIHVHHGFIGIIISLVSLPYGLSFFFNIGIGMFLSDMIHHFIVLWIVIGNPEFHLVYRNIQFFKEKQKKENRKFKIFIRHLIHPT